MARKRTMKPVLMKMGVWNVRGLYGKQKLLQGELKTSKCNCGIDTGHKFLQLTFRRLMSTIVEVPHR